MSEVNKPKEDKGGCGSIIIGVIAFFVILITLNAFFGTSTPETSYLDTQTPIADKKIFTFTLTHGMGQKLLKDATFTAGDTPVWVLNFNNGKDLRYTITGADSDGSICGIKAHDNLGDNCEICITSEGDGKMTLRLRYDERTMVFKGYAN